MLFFQFSHDEVEEEDYSLNDLLLRGRVSAVAVEKELTKASGFGNTMNKNKEPPSCGYWIGSAELLKYFPNTLIKSLGHMEKYLKGWVYSVVTEQVRLMNWSERAAKNHFPCTHGVTVPETSGQPKCLSFAKT